MKLRHRLFEHVLLMLLLALAIFGAAIVLAWMAQWAETLQMPAYLTHGMHPIATLEARAQQCPASCTGQHPI